MFCYLLLNCVWVWYIGAMCHLSCCIFDLVFKGCLLSVCVNYVIVMCVLCCIHFYAFVFIVPILILVICHPLFEFCFLIWYGLKCWLCCLFGLFLFGCVRWVFWLRLDCYVMAGFSSLYCAIEVNLYFMLLCIMVIWCLFQLCVDVYFNCMVNLFDS